MLLRVYDRPDVGGPAGGGGLGRPVLPRAHGQTTWRSYTGNCTRPTPRGHRPAPPRAGILPDAGGAAPAVAPGHSGHPRTLPTPAPCPPPARARPRARPRPPGHDPRPPRAPPHGHDGAGAGRAARHGGRHRSRGRAGAADTSGFGGETAAASAARASPASAYVDSAIPVTQFRLRFDAAYDDNRPDRADFFYPSAVAFGPPGSIPPPSARAGPGQARQLPGAVKLPSTVAANEPAVRLRGSALPLDRHRLQRHQSQREPPRHQRRQFGFQVRPAQGVDRVLTLSCAPTPPPRLPARPGRNNWNLEPAVSLPAPVGAVHPGGRVPDFTPSRAPTTSRNVIRYGAGVSYLAVNGPRFRVAPVTRAGGLDGDQRQRS